MQHDTLTRTGGLEPDWNERFDGLRLFAGTSDIAAPVVVKDLAIQDSTYEGLYISGSHRVLGAVFDGVTINGATTWGLQVKSGGSASLSNVKATNAAQGGSSNTGGMALTLGAGNSVF